MVLQRREQRRNSNSGFEEVRVVVKKWFEVRAAQASSSCLRSPILQLVLLLILEHVVSAEAAGPRPLQVGGASGLHCQVIS